MKKYFEGYVPSYLELKQLDRKYEYVYNLFHICGSGYLRLTYNEDYNKKISLDYIEEGYLHSLYLPICDKSKVIENKFYSLNKENYKNIIEFIILIKQSIVNEVNNLRWG